MADWKRLVRRHLSRVQLPPEREAEIIEEISAHLEDRFRERLARGASEEEALAAVLAELSKGLMLAGELQRVERPSQPEPPVLGARRRNMLGDLWQDTRYGLRTLAKKPGFAATVVLTLALGLGSTTAIFTLVNAVMLRPLPFADADRLAYVYESNPERGWPEFGVSHPNFLDWRAQNHSFEHMAVAVGATVTLNMGGEVEVVRCSAVTADFLPAIGVTPRLGRNFLPEEDRPGGNVRVAIISHGFWQRRFGGDAGVIGRTVTVNDNPFAIVGVLPESFPWGAGRIEMLVPIAPDPARSRGDHRLLVIGKLKPGVSLEEALADMNTIAGRLAEQYPESNKGWSVGAQSFYDWIVPRERREGLIIFAGAVLFVLLIACANVANLQLARGASRQKEISIRAALGASRGRIVQQLLVEAMLLSLAAGLLGLGLAYLLVELLKTMNPDNLPRLAEASLDARVFIFALAASLLTGIIFGLLPALQASRPDLVETLKEGGRQSASGRARLRSALVVAEVALSVALLVGAGLLLRSFWRLQQVDPGFQPDELLTMQIRLPRARYRENPESWTFYQRLLEEIRGLPGVQAAALSSLPPMVGGSTATEVSVPGRSAPSDNRLPSAGWRLVSPGYFAALGIALRGRDFNERDTERSQRVTIISEDLARRLWPGEDAVGKTILLGSFGREPMTVAGVAGDVRSFGLDAETGSMVYVPAALAATWNPMHLVIRSQGEPAAQAPSVRAVLRGIDANVPVYDTRTFTEIISGSLGPRRFNMFLLAGFAGAALLLASVGLFGVMAYLVTQRTHEIGIRLALGARPSDLMHMVMGRGLVLALAGSAIGIAGALALGRLLGSLLFEVAPTDPLSLAAAPLLLLAVALAACFFPARRAMRVDPLIALRHE